MVKKVLYSCLLLSIISCHKDDPVSPTTTAPATDTWTAKASMPTARAYLSGVEVNGKVYLIGGLTDVAHSSDAVEAYDLSSDSWTTKNKMPESFSGLAAVEFGGKIYTFGGRTGHVFSGTTLNHTYLYDPVADSWTRKADMPEARAFLSAVAVNGKIYAMGGSTRGYEGSEIVKMYDPLTDTWSVKPGLQAGVALPAASVFDGNIYLTGGGTSEDNSAGTAYPYFQFFDITSGSWSLKRNLTQGRIGHRSGVIAGRMYICGGFSSNTTLNDLGEYDFGTDTWTSRAVMPSSRRCFASCVWNNQLFVFGGITGSGAVLASVAAYTPPAASN
jgi:N-acetylneuraminic acid mutarotase